MKLTPYLVKPGTTPQLAKRDPSDKADLPAAKPARLAMSGELALQIDTLQDTLYGEHQRGLLIVLQGMDTAGKDGTIRHVFSAVDPLGVRAVSFRAPVGAELEHDFLWRVHQQVPHHGEIVIFNRSHYEDVLIVRVHQWIDLAECKRRYRTINDFEQLLVESGITVLKFFLHISPEEQRKRLQARVDDPNKRWKFNPQDLAERKLWKEYREAYEDAIAATSTKAAPWYVVPADSKSARNLVISSILKQTLESLDLKYPQPPEDYSKIVIK